MTPIKYYKYPDNKDLFNSANLFYHNFKHISRFLKKRNGKRNRQIFASVALHLTILFSISQAPVK